MTAQEFIEMLEECGFDPQSYSGRGMYGKECVSVRDATVWEVGRMLPHDATGIPEPHTDSLGTGIVIYWPKFEWPKEESNA